MRRPAILLVLSAALTAIAVVLALRLTLLTGFEALLPENRMSVRELHRVAEKTAGVSTLFVVLQGAPGISVAAMREAGDALVPEIAKIGSPWVGSVEDGMHEAVRFLGPRAGLFADKDKLEGLRADVDAYYEYAAAKARGDLLDESDPPPQLDLAGVRKRLGVDDLDTERYPGGYYQSKDGRMLVVAVRSKFMGTDFDNGRETIRRVTEVVERVKPRFAPGITYGFGGDLQSAVSEYGAVNQDLTDVGKLGVGLIAAVVFVYYLRLRTLLAMMLTIGVGVAWTFGATQLLIGHLNMATGFLFTIIAGNGINFGIIYMARFLEARRVGASLLDGVRIAHRATWLPTLTAGCAAAASYGSLMVTEFRGFRDFGMIGSIGMVLCWIATYMTLPCILAVMERVSPLKGRAPGGPPSSVAVGFFARLRKATRAGVEFGKPFAAILPIAPRTMCTVGVALALLGIGVTANYVLRGQPMEYNLSKLRNSEEARAEEIKLTRAAEEITGYVGAAGMAILVERVDQVEPLRVALHGVRDKAPADAKPFKEVHALQDFVPRDQAAKIPILRALKEKALLAHKHKVIAGDDWTRIESVLPPDDLVPFGIADLPEGLARPFTETDGTRGRIVYISPLENTAVDDAHYLFRWADSYRETHLPDESVVRGSGRAVIYADMFSAVVDDVPPAVLVSFAATVLVVLVAFRFGRAAVAVLAALMVGVGWMAGLLVAAKVKLNFLNFVALPITFGIGVDYAVNVVERYVREGAGGAATAVRSTGGAVILCSMTTTLGYLALLGSMNEGVKSLGAAAVLGEVSCLLAAVLVLPAALWWIDRGLPDGAKSRLH